MAPLLQVIVCAEQPVDYEDVDCATYELEPLNATESTKLLRSLAPQACGSVVPSILTCLPKPECQSPYVWFEKRLRILSHARTMFSYGTPQRVQNSLITSHAARVFVKSGKLLFTPQAPATLLTRLSKPTNQTVVQKPHVYDDSLLYNDSLLTAATTLLKK